MARHIYVTVAFCLLGWIAWIRILWPTFREFGTLYYAITMVVLVSIEIVASRKSVPGIASWLKSFLYAASLVGPAYYLLL